MPLTRSNSSVYADYSRLFLSTKLIVEESSTTENICPSSSISTANGALMLPV
jgi:hypothetical protein